MPKPGSLNEVNRKARQRPLNPNRANAMRVLLVDPYNHSSQIALMLKANSFAVEHVDLGQDGLDYALSMQYQALLVEEVLPDMSGIAFTRALRGVGNLTPIILLSTFNAPAVGARNGEVDALNAGVDHYMTKPFNADTMIARIHAVVRRAQGLASKVVTFGTLEIDLDRKAVDVAGKRLHLTNREYEILECLALNPTRTASKGVLLDYMYGGRDEPMAKIVDVFVCKLRNKIRDAGGDPRVLETVWGQGYCLKNPPVAEAAQ